MKNKSLTHPSKPLGLFTHALRRCRTLTLGTLAALLFAPMVSASPVLVTIDTSALQGLNGYLAFDLVAGDQPGKPMVAISSFAGNTNLGSASSSGAVSGNLQAGPLTLGGAGQFFSEWLQYADSFGSKISYVLDFMPSAGSGSGRPDQFSFFLLDANQLPFPTSDPSGAGALFSIDLMGPDSVAQIYASSSASVRIDPIGNGQVPEPVSWLLVGVGLLAASLARHRALTPR